MHMSTNGVNVIIDVEGESGLHEGARLLLRALQAARISTSVVPLVWGNVRSRDGLERSRVVATGHRYPVNILCYNLNQLQGIGPVEFSDLTQDGYTIGYWAWELPAVAAEHLGQVERVHDIWVPSAFTAQAFAAGAQRAAQVVPHPVCVERPNAGDLAVDIPSRAFVVLFTFSVMSSFARKNPLAVVDAFRAAFGTSKPDGPLLVVKAHCGEDYPDAMRTLRRAVASVGGLLIEDNFTRAQMLALLDRANCYISLHRSEAFGLGMAESMWLAKPVVATGYSGNVEYMNYLNSWLVDFTLREITVDDHKHQPRLQTLYPAGQFWAEPSGEDAAAQLTRVYEHPEEARERSLVGAISVQQHFSAERIGARVRRLLAQVDPSMNLAVAVRSSEPVRSFDFTFDAEVPGNGWHAPERRQVDGRAIAYRWTSGATATFERAVAVDHDLGFELDIVAAVSAEVAGSLRLLVNEQAVDSSIEYFPDGRARVCGVIPRHLLSIPGRPTRFGFNVLRTIRPSDELGTGDTRRVGVAISRFAVGPGPSARMGTD
jgi:glycosyltransferase involved in cell wall biosynthesis